MNRLITAASAIAAKAVVAEEYQRFVDAMDWYKYDWEPVKVTTEDGFILTAFHITGNGKETFTPTKPPVLIMHGDFGDGTDWFDSYWGLPLHLLLADAGYDVWIGNNRGTEYSQEHETLSVNDAAFWDWSWAEMGLYDDVALIKKMNESSISGKSYYIGYSQGTIQMLYGLAHREEEFFADNLHKFVAFAPCTVQAKWGPASRWEEGLFKFPEAGIHSFYDKPNWKQGQKNERKVCREFSDWDCDYVKCNDCEPVSVKSQIHWWQNAYSDGTGRFQEFDPDWFGPVWPDLVPIENISKVEISMLVPRNDKECTPQFASEARDKIGAAVTTYKLLDGDHGFFWGNNDEDFIQLVMDELKVSGEEDEAREIIGTAADKLSQCDEGCTECRNAWMSDNESNVYQVCKDTTVYKYSNPCKESQDNDKCATDSGEPCLMSYDFADKKKWRSDSKACRTVPDSLRNELSGTVSNDDFKWARKTRNDNKRGICSYTADGTCGECKFSFINDTDVNPQKWKGSSAMNRCKSLS